jgi:hypothetical protein
MSPTKKDDTQKIHTEPSGSDTQQIKTKTSGSDTQQIKTKPSGGDTQHIKTKSQGSDTQQIKTKPAKELRVKKPKLWRVILTGILLVIILAAGGGALGYKRGIADRLNKQNEKIISEAATQYQYGLQQMSSGNYELARTHFEYVMKIYPNFPGLTEKYTEVMLQIAKTNAPTATPMATLLWIPAMWRPSSHKHSSKFKASSGNLPSTRWNPYAIPITNTALSKWMGCITSPCVTVQWK